MIVLLVRHSRAGERAEWTGDDRRRPLDAKGRRQAKGLIELVREYPIDRIVSSPYDRCVQTVIPLAEARGLEVEHARELAEGESTKEDVLRLLERLDADTVVLCTHGDVVEELLGEELRKGATQVLELDDGRITPRAYLGRPG